MNAAAEPANPLSSLFTGSEAAKVIDFLLSNEQHQTMAEIHASTRTSMNTINKVINNLLDIDAAGIGAKRVQDKHVDEDTYYIRDDTDTGKSIRDLRYHLMQVQSKSY
ncbi:MAG TPA: hypothetical protein VHK86_03060 [Nitrososphaera sp.]|jgi:transcription initiation factor IIE alpha subunit|nr:hypothetical protein [Nitrososphaera sp.]HEX2615859.1 hypothetical protein [Nitrososphaera sp.]